MLKKTLKNTDSEPTTKNVKDVVVWGEGDMFKLLSKASSELEGWMKSTKAMDTGIGCVVQVTTQQMNEDGSYALAEAITFVPGVVIAEVRSKDTGEVTSRKLMTKDQLDEIIEMEKENNGEK